MAIVLAVTWVGRGSDFSVGSDCLNAVKAGPKKKLLSKYAERSAVGLPGAGNWTAVFYEVCRLAEAEKLLPREPQARMNWILLRTR